MRVLPGPSRDTRAFAPRIVVYACSASALLTVLLDAAHHSDPLRLSVGLPLALIAAVVTYAPAVLLLAASRMLHARRLALPIWTALAVFCLGFWLSNVLLVDRAFEARTMLGYALSLALAMGAGVWARRHEHDPGERRLGAAMAVTCVALFVVEEHAPPIHYPIVRATLAALLATTLTSTLLLHGRPRRSWLAPAAAGLLGAILLVLPSPVWRAAVFAQPTLESYVFGQLARTPARALLMRSVGANECSFSGALALVQAPCPTVPVPLPWADPPHADSPLEPNGVRAAKIVLLTVDAFRCGPHERAPFSAACARVARYASMGSVRVSYPATRPSLLDLHGGEYETSLDGDSWLASRLFARGYRGTAIVTHPQLRIAPIQRSFAAWDESLLELAGAASAASSAAISSAVIERLREPERAFVWAHYYDPHDPYLPASGGHLTVSDQSAYAAELQRVDTAIAGVLEAAEQLQVPTLVAVTGDHGEGFGEHSATHHGYELYDNAVRVPWFAAAFHGAVLPLSAPRQSIDIAAWLEGAAGGARFQPHPPRPMRTERLWALCDGRHKLIVNRENGWLELYDLHADPRETQNLARVDVATTQRMLAGLLAALPSH